MKVLLVGEGASELGGALESLVQRLGLNDAEFESKPANRADLHAFNGKGPGHLKRAVRWMLLAQKEGFDAIVLVIDQDGRSERSTEFAQAQDYTGTSICRALGVAIETFEAWMLADEVALTNALGYRVPRQPDPESIRKSKLKPTIDDLLSKCDKSMGPPNVYAAIAGAADLAVLEERCSRGFAPFAQRVRALSAAAG